MHLTSVVISSVCLLQNRLASRFGRRRVGFMYRASDGATSPLSNVPKKGKIHLYVYLLLSFNASFACG